MLPAIMDRLEATYGAPAWSGPTDPYEFLIWLNCGYPASDTACATGYANLASSIGTAPEAILAATDRALAAVLATGGMAPELRALRLKQIAERAEELYELEGRPVRDACALLASFPTIGEAAADRILLFCGLAPRVVVPSGALHVLLRLGYGAESKNWGKTYSSIRDAAAEALSDDIPGLQRAYLLLKAHAQGSCKKSKPRCTDCPLRRDCPWLLAGEAKESLTGKRQD